MGTAIPVCASAGEKRKRKPPSSADTRTGSANQGITVEKQQESILSADSLRSLAVVLVVLAQSM
jgi:hypothetical protein